MALLCPAAAAATREWEVRPALWSELPSAVTCINEAFAHKPGEVDYSMNSTGRTDLDNIQNCHNTEGCVIFCCRDGAETVGVVVYNSDSATAAEPVVINMLATRPSHERRGIAGALVAACEDQAAREARPSVVAEIVSVQRYLRGVYKSWGFTQVGFEQPEHMKLWVKPEFLPTIGLLIYKKSTRGGSARL